jgi:hypothetical protein
MPLPRHGLKAVFMPHQGQAFFDLFNLTRIFALCQRFARLCVPLPRLCQADIGVGT